MSGIKRETIKILKKLASGNKINFIKINQGGEKFNNIISDLKRRALIEDAQEGNLRITWEGKAFLKRSLCKTDEIYAAQHRDLVGVSGDEKIILNLSESPLSRLYNRRHRDGKRLIQKHQFLAGERLRSDFEAAQLSPKVGLTLGPKVDGNSGAANGAHALDSAIAARARLDEALRFVGNEMNSLLLDVCCFLKGLECVERERQWPVRSAKIVLALALERLADHYGYSTSAVGAPIEGRKTTKVWHLEDENKRS